VISNDAIIEWQSTVGFASSQHAEQDLVLSRLIIEIANNPMLGEELVFRGGTCLHKLHLAKPLRYSEDLDYVRSTNTPIGPFIDQLRGLGEMLGMKVNTEISRHPKVYLRSDFEDGGGRMRIKIEMNTFETSRAFDPIRVPFRVDSRWWVGTADVKTFRVEELVATKLRALYQRRKGRAH
jgi:predicted nucleotidyltransferase component of viral defense system